MEIIWGIAVFALGIAAVIGSIKVFQGNSKKDSGL